MSILTMWMMLGSCVAGYFAGYYLRTRQEQQDYERWREAEKTLVLIAEEERTYLGNGDFIEQPLPGYVCQKLARDVLVKLGSGR